jgi:hypothetical protein
MWLKLHKPVLLEKFQLSDFEKHLMQQGNEVESCARNLFPGGIAVSSNGEGACHETVRLMDSKMPTIFQATFIVDGFIARNDMLSFNKVTGVWDLYEVKGGNSVKEHDADHSHIDDVAFQVSVLKRVGVPLGSYYIVHLNKEYVRSGDLDIPKLFIVEDKTEEVKAVLDGVEKQMAAAREYLNRAEEPLGSCECVYRGRKKHCATFQYSNSHVPEYSVHDISYISQKKLNLLIEGGIFDLKDIPEEFALSENQRNQILAHERQEPIIDKGSIKDILGKLSFPLYFFDYEAYGPAIPAFNGFSPYKRIPFQFSLHILKSPTSKPEHVEFLHEDLSDPSEHVGRILKENFVPGGTFIAWHKSYEAGVNDEIALRLPQYKELFGKINDSLYDLKEIFTAQHYIHPDFRGKTSIKKVLPAIVPDLRYGDINIREGGQAADAWWTMVSSLISPESKQTIIKDLKTYCGLDTYAMYAIWKHLYDITL